MLDIIDNINNYSRSDKCICSCTKEEYTNTDSFIDVNTCSNDKDICLCNNYIRYYAFLPIQCNSIKYDYDTNSEYFTKIVFSTIKIINNIFNKKICSVNPEFTKYDNYVQWELFHKIVINGMKQSLDNAIINIRLDIYNEHCLRLIFRLDNSLNLSENIKNELDISEQSDIDDMYACGYNFNSLSSVKKSLNDESMFIYSCYHISSIIKNKLLLFIDYISNN